MRILVVEDEPKAGDYLRNGLIESGYAADLARDGAAGLRLALATRYDAIVLDVMLPGLDGWQLLARLREQREPPPVLFLSARGTLEDRLKGLELGADDYLVKPFSFAELLARLRVALRRAPARQLQTPDDDGALTLADLRLDTALRQAQRGASPIALTNKEYALLHFFLSHQEQVLSRSLIASRVWDMNFDSDTNVVDVAVRRLRQKVEEPFAPPRLIHTVRGVGYRCGLAP
ncbi:heavy metal response regulator transcription factor [Rugamonas rubra]|uniref:Two-component system, OmpR family, copper resistance phosphate regulon response regulator CusR n=1 Tax=Rugamonas rubra TaxID=758825 RepID=A0A1I4RE54_9BURK|nr:heavy metal response regulator transcription factor [Rugamonas rubra]SFM50568.1 two-component system, OmpR family, copper resistance phosphate regulon response regulator CusR [Rugamonas rubra]